MKKWYIFWRNKGKVMNFIEGDDGELACYDSEEEAHDSMNGHILENVCEAIEL